ncbi:hypothetical protein Salpa_2795 [Sporomusa sp. KB1]|jgi:hypothetical protein|nr:hypothetical protein Salpa_2795 [Sporomusa sp. KB1]
MRQGTMVMSITNNATAPCLMSGTFPCFLDKVVKREVSLLSTYGLGVDFN